ncbi:MAG: dehydrogenase [Holophagaceae bacterium]|nr:dehydrogenase [Holophagaceae bacterium]
MPYMLLIMEPREQRQGRSPEAGRAVYDRMLRFTENLQSRGLLKASNSLRSDREGVRVEVRGGKPTLMDGPFSESKEMVGGFFYLDCKTKAEAVAIAESCPAAEWSTIEVREIGPCFDD